MISLGGSAELTCQAVHDLRPFFDFLCLTVDNMSVERTARYVAIPFAVPAAFIVALNVAACYQRLRLDGHPLEITGSQAFVLGPRNRSPFQWMR